MEMSTTHHDNQQKANGARQLFGSFLNRKKTWMTNEMAIRTRANKTRPHLGLFLHIRP